MAHDIADYKMLIGGKWKDSSDGRMIEVTSPIDEQVIGHVPQGTREDAVAALTTSQAAFKAWAQTPAVERAEYLLKLAGALWERKEEFALSLTLEQGKTIREARGEVDASIMFMEYGAGHARRLQGDINPSQNRDEQVWIQKVPHGVTVGIVPWNYPLSLSARKFANALVCGNTMIIKPPSITPLTVMKFAQLIKTVGMPDGVLNIVTGRGSDMGDELVRNPISKLVSLTGSTSAGRMFYEAAAEHIKILRLELGGKAPFIVMEDADVDKAVKAAVIARYSNCGQICVCNERMYVHEAVYDRFLEKFMSEVKTLKVGDPREENTDMGPKVSGEELEKLVKVMEKAKDQGAKVLCGGRKLKGGIFDRGYWFEPTAVEVKDNKMEIMQEETFGPIAPIMKIRSFDQALELANDSVYGLSAYLFTNTPRRVMRAVNELEFGEVYVNRTCGEQVNGFHTGYKHSGVGGEDGQYGLEAYLRNKTMYINYAE
jgi:lactaldehyde dehydrogenase/glycolaldehyde dehydrogenase